MAKIWLNGQFLDEWDAVISVKDRGFRFGDGIFETIPFYHNTPYQLPLHRKRLEQGLQAIRIQADLEKLFEALPALIRLHSETEGLIRISVSRGAGSIGYLPSASTHPTLLMEITERAPKPEKPVILSVSSLEKPSPKSLPTRYKLAQGLNSTLAKMEAVDAQCFDAILLNADGHVVETSSANIFWIKDGVYYTPDLATGALEGITRNTVHRLRKEAVQTGHYSLEALLAADAAFLTNAAYGVLPIAGIKDHPSAFDPSLVLPIQTAYLQDIHDATHSAPLA